MSSFDFSSLSPSLTERLKSYGIKQPSKLQLELLEKMLNKKPLNLICKCPENKDKTFSYLIPIVNEILSSSDNKGQNEEIGINYLILTSSKQNVNYLHKLCKELLDDFNNEKIFVFAQNVADKKKEEENVKKESLRLIISTPQKLCEHINSTTTAKMLRIHAISTIIFVDIGPKLHRRNQRNRRNFRVL